MAQAANQAQPSIRPAITSDSQCRSSSTRLQATATASATAVPASLARVRRLRRRARISAAAAKNAAAVDEWPLGNDGPSVTAAGLSVGRARSTTPLMRLVMRLSPSVTTSRNGTSQRSTDAHQLDDRKRHTEHDHKRGVAELGDRVQAVCGETAGMNVAPVSGGLVDVHQRLAGAKQQRQQRHHDSAGHQQRHRHRQGQAGGNLRVEATAQAAA